MEQEGNLTEATWSQSDYAEWADGSRRLTGPGIVFFDASGRVVRVDGQQPALPEGDTNSPTGAQTETDASTANAQGSSNGVAG